MKRFYFTYGSEGQPFCGGWTEVIAPDFDTAIALFRAYHPDLQDGIMNCAGVYSEERFRKTSMFANGNFGKRCWEKIFVHRAFAEKQE